MTLHSSGNVYLDMEVDFDAEFQMCYVCKATKHKQAMSDDHTKFGGGTTVCLECYGKKKPSTAEKRSRANLAHRLRRDFDMTLDQYDAILVAQGNKCATCDCTNPNVNGLTGWCVNYAHDGDGQLVRGITCHACDQLLLKYDDEESLSLWLTQTIELSQMIERLQEYITLPPAQIVAPGLRSTRG